MLVAVVPTDGRNLAVLKLSSRLRLANKSNLLRVAHPMNAPQVFETPEPQPRRPIGRDVIRVAMTGRMRTRCHETCPSASDCKDTAPSRSGQELTA